MSPKMNILITGATGFIGRHLAGALSKTFSVRCLVRKSSDIIPLRELKVDIVYGDLLDKDSILPALDGIDLVYHLAGEVYARRKQDYYNGNVLATHNLLEACEEKSAKRIIFLSSTGVFKPTYTRELLTEEAECDPISIYGKTKLEAEGLIRQCGIPWVIVRASLIYGPHQKSVLDRFFREAITKGKIYIMGNGDNLRSFCFIDNFVGGLILLADKPEVVGKTYILSDNVPYTYNKVIETASKAIQKEIRVIRLPSFLGGISWKIFRLVDTVFNLSFVELYAIAKMQFHEGYNIAKAKNEIGYNPSIPLETGIRRTVDWMKNSLSNKC
jgi:nucleoside-diphosphate-sugar epimerase